MRLHCISLLLCQIYVVYGTSRVDSKFSKNLKLNQSLLHNIHKAILNSEPTVLKDVNPKIQDRELEFYDNMTKNVLNAHLYTIKYNLPVLLSKYQKHAIKKGISKISSVLKYVSKKLQLEHKRLPFLTDITRDFTKKSYQYFNSIKKGPVETDIDIEFFMLHVVETFNDLLFNEEVRIFDNLVSKSGGVSKPSLLDITKQVQQDLDETRRDDLRFLCLKLTICRPVEGFSDYISDLIHELLKLSDFKLKAFFLKLSIPIMDQSEFFHSIFGETCALSIGMKLGDRVFRDVSETRSFMMALRLFLAKKHIFPQSKDKEANIINKALRILVDIIDKSFDVNNDIAKHFDVLLKTISKWSLNEKFEIQKVLKHFVEEAVKILKNNLNEEAKMEIRALADVLMKRVDVDNQVYRYIFAQGSKFVKGDVSS